MPRGGLPWFLPVKPMPSPAPGPSPPAQAPRGPYDIVKRILDIALAGVGLVALSPLLAVVAALVKATSRGPVLFHQARAGQGGKQASPMLLNFEESQNTPFGQGGQGLDSSGRKQVQAGLLKSLASRKFSAQSCIDLVRTVLLVFGPKETTSAWIHRNRQRS